MFLNPADVKEFIKRAESEDEVIVVRCVRKTAASKVGGPDKGELYDLHCTMKPKDYVAVGTRDRKEEDAKNGVLTVFASNRRDEKTGQLGSWRRVNVAQVKKLIYKGIEYEVTAST